MTPIDVINLAKEESAVLYVKDGALKCKPGKMGLSSNLVSGIKSNKTQLIELLTESEKKGKSISSSVAKDKDEYTSVSFAQCRMFIEHQSDHEGALTIPLVFSVDTPIEPSLFKGAIEGVCKKHPSLSQGYLLDEKGVRTYHLDDLPYVECLDGRGLSDNAIKDLLLSWSEYRFNLEKDIKLRACIINLGESSLVAFITHHICVDGKSLHIIVEDFISHIKKESDLSCMEYSYLDFSHNEREYVKNSKESLTYWSDLLKGAPQNHNLPCLSNGKSGLFGTGTKSIKLSRNESEKFFKYCKDNKLSVFSVLSSLWALSISQCSYTNDVVLGTPVSGRPSSADDGVVGPYINSLPIRAKIDSSQSLEGYVKEMSLQLSNSLDNQFIPFEKIVECSGQTRTNTVNPVFQLFHTHRNEDHSVLNVEGLEVQIIKDIHQVKRRFDIECATGEINGELVTDVSYDSYKFGENLIDSLLSVFKNLIENLPALSTELISSINLCETGYLVQGEFKNLAQEHHVLAEVIEKCDAYPSDLAIMSSSGEGMTYSELKNKISQVSSYIKRNTQGDCVAVRVDRNISLPAILLGIWHAGKSYLPLDKSYPEERLAFMIEDAGVKDVIVDEESFTSQVKEHTVSSIFSKNADDLVLGDPKVNLSGIAYIIYTSGTTGRPKGVMVTHSSVNNFIFSMQSLLELSKSDRLLSVTPISFDISVLEIFLPLFSGGSLCILKSGESKNPEVIKQILSKQNISIMQATPSTWKMLKSQSSDIKFDGLTAISGGESLDEDLYKWFRTSFREAWNMYGPTETTVWSTALKLMDGNLSIGKPILNTSICIASELNMPLPKGALGELLIGGDGLSLGYLNRPELTNEKFVYIDNKRYYKTGDLAVFGGDESIHCYGRIDHQVKINGHRIELQEIDSVAKSVEGVFDVVTDIVVNNGKDNLVTFIVSNGDDSSSLIEQLEVKFRNYLPYFMRPSSVQLVDSIPLTPNGKIDRKQLPSMYLPTKKEILDQETTDNSPVSSLFSVFLGKQVSNNEDFFVSGGDSLTAIRLLNAINDTFDSSITLSDFFKSPNVEGISLLLKQKNISSLKIEKAPDMSIYPVSSNQKRLWYAHHADAHNGALTMRYHFWMDSDINIQRLENAVKELVSNHEILRTVYEHEPKTGDVFQKVLSEYEPCILVSRDIFSNKEDAQNWIDSKAVTPFDLKSDLSLRVCVGRVDGGNVIELSLPHIACDAWSVKKITEELLIAYSGKSLVKPKFDYKDYAYWEKSQLNSELIFNSLEYWKDVLVDVPAYSALPLVGNEGHFTGKGFRVRKQLNERSHEAISQIRSQTGLSDFAILYAVFNVLSSWLSSENKVGITTPVSGRNHIGFENTLGCFVNSAVLCTDLNSEKQISEYLSDVKTVLESAWEHSNIPFDEVLKHFNHNTNNGLVPFSSFVFSSESHKGERGKEAIDSASIGTQALIKLHCDVTPSGTTFLWDIDNGASSPDLVEIYSFYLGEMLTFIANNKDEKLDFLRAHVAKDSSPVEKGCELSTKTNVISSVIRHAKDNPNRIAVQCKQHQLTYADLLSASAKVADFLINECSVKKGDVVVTRYTRHSHAIVAALGTIMAGAVNMPMEPNQNTNKSMYMLEKSNPKCMLTDLEMDTSEHDFVCHSVSSILCNYKNVEPGSLIVRSQSSAFLLFTSGSTGKSKGVLLEHGGVTYAMTSMLEFMQASEKDVFLMYASAGFDAYTYEWLCPLLIGASLCIASNEERLDMHKLELFIRDNSITSIGMTPSSLLYMNPENVPTIRKISVFGESFPSSLISKWNKKANLFNAYGPTEASICVSMSRVIEHKKITIGSPFSGVQWEVTNNEGNVCPVGVSGELVIIGDAVATRYLENTVTGNSGMFYHESTMSRGYRTGDKVIVMPSGEMVFLGRMTDEFKLMGQRLSMEEIRSNVSDATNNGKSAVLFDEDNRILLAFVTDDDLVTIESALSRLPHKIIKLKDIPLTLNGKVDYSLLKINSQTDSTSFIKEPSSDIEKIVLCIWKEILGSDEIGVNDGIYKVGGNSISLARIAHACSEHFEVKTDLSSFISLTTVEQQSELIENLIAEKVDQNEEDADLEEFEL